MNLVKLTGFQPYTMVHKGKYFKFSFRGYVFTMNNVDEVVVDPLTDCGQITHFHITQMIQNSDFVVHEGQVIKSRYIATGLANTLYQNGIAIDSPEQVKRFESLKF